MFPHYHFSKKTPNLIPVLAIIFFVCLLVGVFYQYFFVQSKSANSQNPQTYFIKNHHVYYQEKLQVYDNGKLVSQTKDLEIAEADPKTFQTLDIFWAKDRENIFYQGQVVSPASGTPKLDPATFTFLATSSMLAKDKDHVYSIVHKPNVEKGSDLIYQVISGADPATFTLIEGFPYATDKNNVYYVSNVDEVTKLVGLNPQSFQVLGACGGAEVYRDYYATDGHSVVAGDKILPSADGQTFRIVVDFDNGSDGMTMESTYSVDKNHVYKSCGEIMPHGDPQKCSFFDLQACE